MTRKISGVTLASSLLGLLLLPSVGSLSASDLQAPSTFDEIGDERDRSIALMKEAGKALLHPRCVNCHPAGDRPLQGEDGRLHEPPVLRGAGGMGVVGMQCFTCHLTENYDPGEVPGAPHWRLAPATMAWEGESLGDICRQIQDPERNGGHTLDEIVEHMVSDELVAWGWTPGNGREPAPGTHDRFGELIRAWAETGAACPD